MFRKTYDWVMGLAGSRHASKALAAVSFAESSFFPIPPDVMLAPMVLARPDRAFVYAGICTAASVLGGLLGYAIGFYLEPVGMWLLSVIGHADGKAAFEKWFADWGLWVILIKGATPIPYKLVTITSGFAEYSLFWFIVLSVITRGARFYLLAALLHYFGPSAREFIEKRLGLVTLVFLAVVVLGLVAAAYLA